MLVISLVKSFRYLYFSILTTYYQHMPASAVNDLDIGELIESEVEHLESDSKNLEDVLQIICSGFFWAALTRDKIWPLQLSEYIIYFF